MAWPSKDQQRRAVKGQKEREQVGSTWNSAFSMTAKSAILQFTFSVHRKGDAWAERMGPGHRGRPKLKRTTPLFFFFPFFGKM